MLKKKSKKIFIFLAVIGLLIFLHYIMVLRPIENFVIEILKPVSTRMYKISSNIKLSYQNQTDKRDLFKIISETNEKVNELTVENVRLKGLEDENEKLRQHLKFLEQNKFNFVLAHVLSHGTSLNQSEAREEIVIDKGSKDGVVLGQAVASDKGYLIGKIQEVEDEISKVYLVTNKKCKVAATLQNEDKTVGITEGELGLTIKMNFIPQTEIVSLGDNVITSGLEKNIPRGVVIGKVMEVEKDSNEVWQSATIEPLVNSNDLTILSVILQ